MSKPKIESLFIGCEQNGVQTLVINGNEHIYPTAASTEFVINKLSNIYSLTINDIKDIKLMW